MRPFRGLILLLAGASLVSCSTWHRIPVEPGVVPTIGNGHPVRAVRTDSTFAVLYHPLIVGDSLIGEVGYPPLRTAIALRDIATLHALGFSPARTGVAAAAGVGVVAVVLGALLAGFMVAML